MIRFLNGPAKGVRLELRRAPVFLRVVFNSGREQDQFDALDQLDDTPEPDEQIWVYRRIGKAGTLHVLYTEKGRRRGKWLATGDYGLCREQPAEEIMRDKEKWQAWCTEQWEGEK